MKYIVLSICIVAVLFTACNRDELFDREQYKAVIALKCNADHFVTQILDLNSQDDVGFVKGSISAIIGGSLPTKEKTVITIVEDPSLLNEYNLYNYETDAGKYYRFLPKSRYKIPEMKITIPAGHNSGQMPIWVNANGLSPDSVYIIPFRVVNCTNYEMNPDKSYLFYRIERKNYWSYTSVNGTTLAAPTYQQRGSFIGGSQANYNDLISWLANPTPTRPSATQTVITKDVYVVSHNELRVLGHNLSGVASGEVPGVYFPRHSIKIKIGDDGKLTITPWREDHIQGMDVEQVDDDNFDPLNRYLNTYELVEDDWGFQYHVFRLCYDYIDFGVTYKRRIWEELRLEYVVDVTKL